MDVLLQDLEESILQNSPLTFFPNSNDSAQDDSADAVVLHVEVPLLNAQLNTSTLNSDTDCACE